MRPSPDCSPDILGFFHNNYEPDSLRRLTASENPAKKSSVIYQIASVDSTACKASGYLSSAETSGGFSAIAEFAVVVSVSSVDCIERFVRGTSWDVKPTV